MEKVSEGLCHRGGVAHLTFFGGVVGKVHESLAVADAEGSERVETDEGAVVLCAVIVRTLHERTLREEVSHFEIGSHRRTQVTGQGCVLDRIFKTFLIVHEEKIRDVLV